MMPIYAELEIKFLYTNIHKSFIFKLAVSLPDEQSF